MLDLAQLCIEPGKAAWVLTADVVCLDHDGNCTDAAMLSLVGALLSTRLPKPTFDKDADKVVVSSGGCTHYQSLASLMF